MKLPPVRRAVVAGVLAVSAIAPIALPMPAHAQFGGIVYDPTNYAQNVLTAARSLQQINNQIQQIQNQATSLINEARNLTSLPFSSLQQLQQQPRRRLVHQRHQRAQRNNGEDGQLVAALRQLLRQQLEQRPGLRGRHVAELVEPVGDALLVLGTAAGVNPDALVAELFAKVKHDAGDTDA